MKIKSEGYDSFILEEVFNPISLISAKKEKLSIVMRDSGFELWYQDKEGGEYHQYEFKDGVVRKMGDEFKDSSQLGL
jgi:hypothetical protein